MQIINPGKYLSELRTAASSDGFTFNTYGAVYGFDLPVIERNGESNGPTVYISTGTHGDEPAGPLAILDILRKHTLPHQLNYLIFPLINPTGLEMGTRENRDRIDLNRDYGTSPDSNEIRAHIQYLRDRLFDLGMCLHEDSDGDGFYLYSHLARQTDVDYPGLALAAAKPITGIDLRTEIDGMPAAGGRMQPPASVIEGFGDNLPESLYLIQQHGLQYSFTTETPSGQPLELRIAAQKKVIEVILGSYLIQR